MIYSVIENADSTIAIASKDSSSSLDFILLTVFIIFFLIFRLVIKVFENNKEKDDDKKSAGDLEKQEHLLIEANKDKSRNAFVILRELQEKGSMPDISIFNKLLEMSVRLDQFDNVHKMYEIISDEVASPVTVDVTTFRILYKALAAECRISKDKDLLEKIKLYDEEMNKKGFKIDQTVFNAKISIYINLAMYESGCQCYKLMKQNAFTPDCETCSLLLDGIISSINESEYSKFNPDVISEILEQAKKVNYLNSPHRESVLTKLMQIYLSLNMKETAEEIFEDLKRYPQIGINSYTLLLKEYLSSKNLKKAYELFTEIRFRFVRIEDKFYEDLMNLAYENNKTEIMNDIFAKMKMDKILLNEVLYRNLLIANKRSKSYLKVFELYDSIPGEMLNKCDIDLMNALLESYLECGLYAKVFRLFEYMKRKSEEIETFPRANMNTYILVIRSYILSGKLDDAKQLYMIIKEKANSNSSDFFNAIADTFANCGEIDTTMAIINEMKQYGISKSSETYAIILKIHSDQLNEEKCIITFDEMLRENLKPNISIYHSLLQLFIKKKKIHQAVGILTDIKLNKFIADQTAYNAIVVACVNNEMIEKAMEYLIESSTNEIYLPLDTYRLLLDTLSSSKNIKQSDKMRFSDVISKILKMLREKNTKQTV